MSRGARRRAAASADPGPNVHPVVDGARGRWRGHLVFACVALAYLVVFPYFRALEVPNENVRVYATRALVAHGTWQIDGVVAAWGPVTDTAAVSGRRYSSKAPGTSLLGVPVHFVHDRIAQAALGRPPSLAASIYVLRVVTVIVPLLVFLFAFGRRVLAETGAPLARDLLVLGLGLGTMMYSYGLTYVGHAQSAALLFAGFLALVPAGGAAPTRGRLALAGALAGLAVVFEYQSLLGAVVLAGFAAVTLRQRTGWFLLGALAPALLLAGYHTALFGRPWQLPYAHLDDSGYQLYHHGQGFLGLGRPRVRVIAAALVSPAYGLFVYSPLLALGLALAIVGAGRRDAVARLALIITVVMVLFLAGMANWRGGWCAAGPRYIAVVVPFLAFAVARGWRAFVAPRVWLLAAALAATVVSVVLAGLAGLFPHFPVQLDSPIFDLVLPLVAKGFVPHGLGTALGLAGLPALVPWLLPIGAALVLLLRQAPGWRVRAGAVIVAAVALGALAGYGRDTREDQRVRTFIEGIWEPRPRGATPGGAEHGPA